MKNEYASILSFRQCYIHDAGNNTNKDLENHPFTLLGIVAFNEENTWAVPRRGGTPSFKVSS